MGRLRCGGGVGMYDSLTAPPHSCDTGGDCECLCSAIATYADECARHRHHVRWRSQELCRECVLLNTAYIEPLESPLTASPVPSAGYLVTQVQM